MKIRKAKISDAEEIRDLYNELREHELSLLPKSVIGIQLNWEPKKTVKHIKKLLRSRNKITFIAEIDGRIVGVISGGVSKGIKHKEGSFGIYVKKEFRGKGIGKRLTRELFKWFKSKGCKTIMLNVYSSNKKAKKFYKRLGFKLVTEIYKRKIKK